jgi:hypothetical protein
MGLLVALLTTGRTVRRLPRSAGAAAVLRRLCLPLAFCLLAASARAAPITACSPPGAASYRVLRTVGVTCHNANKLMNRLFAEPGAYQGRLGKTRHYIVLGRTGVGTKLRPFRCRVRYSKDHGPNRNGILLKVRCRSKGGYRVLLTEHQDNE